MKRSKRKSLKKRSKKIKRIKNDGYYPDYDEQYNIAEYLNLPLYFKEIVKNNADICNYDMYSKLKDMYEEGFTDYNPIIDKPKCIANIKFMLEFISNAKTVNGRKVLSIYLYNLLDTDKYSAFINIEQKKFKTTVDRKLEEFYNENDRLFATYLINTFEVGRYYLSRQKNAAHEEFSLL